MTEFKNSVMMELRQVHEQKSVLEQVTSIYMNWEVLDLTFWLLR